MNKRVLIPMTVCFLLAAGTVCAGPVHVNLLTNPGGETGDMSGWSVIENGGNGWAVTGSPVHSDSYAFVTSYQWGKRYQEIDLFAAGFSAGELALAPDIAVSEWFGSRGDSAAQYYMKVELRDSDRNQIAVWDTGTLTQAAGAGWIEQSHVFSDYGNSVRYVYFEDGGISVNYWAGHYGAHLDDASVQVIPEPAAALLSLGGFFLLFVVRRKLQDAFCVQ